MVRLDSSFATSYLLEAYNVYLHDLSRMLTVAGDFPIFPYHWPLSDPYLGILYTTSILLQVIFVLDLFRIMGVHFARVVHTSTLTPDCRSNRVFYNNDLGSHTTRHKHSWV